MLGKGSVLVWCLYAQHMYLSTLIAQVCLTMIAQSISSSYLFLPSALAQFGFEESQPLALTQVQACSMSSTC